MITDFTDRRPALSALLIVFLFTVVPGAFLFLGGLFGDGGISTKIVFVYVLVLQVILWVKLDRPILVMTPFILSLLGFIVSEVVYTVSLSNAPVGAGPSFSALLFSSALVVLFGIVGVGSIGGLLVFGAIIILKKLWESIVRR